MNKRETIQSALATAKGEQRQFANVGRVARNKGISKIYTDRADYLGVLIGCAEEWLKEHKDDVV